MADLFIQKEAQNVYRAYLDQSDIVSIKRVENSPSLISFSSGKRIPSSCLSCDETPCLEAPYFDPVLEALSAVQPKKLCATDAISIGETGKPEVSPQKCIGCGLCVAACPVGAIYFGDDQIAVVNVDEQGLVYSDESFKLASLSDIEYLNEIVKESDEIFEKVFARIEEQTNRTVVLNRLVQGLLNYSDIPNQITRLGDVNLRMDGIGVYANKHLVIENEIDTDLDTLRDILDDCAVLCARYEIDKENVLGLIVSMRFPNKRSEYWEVLDDIQKVLDLTIHTIPLAALLITTWNDEKFDISSYFLSKNNTSSRKTLNEAIGRELNISEPSELLEAAK